LTLWKRIKNYRLPSTATSPFCPSATEGTIQVPSHASDWKKRFLYAGTGLMVAIGYMDPGNWATDIEAGSRFGYRLLCVVLLSCVIATFLQWVCVRVGLSTGRDLAQLCNDQYGRRTSFVLWMLAELGIVACDIAEVLGTALAFKILLGVSLSLGVILTAFDTLVVLFFQGKGYRRIEAFVLGLVTIIGAVFLLELLLAQPHMGEAFHGLLDFKGMFSNQDTWYLSLGILGATVMPHNLFLHTSIVKTRLTSSTDQAKETAIRFTSQDTFVSLFLAFFVNAAILMLAAAVFYAGGHQEVVDIEGAQNLLSPLLGTAAAGFFFAIALLAAGQSSTITGTIAGQVVLDGFLNIKLPCWKRRVITRTLALLPAWFGVTLMGPGSLGRMLVFSQVVLSLQLPFAVFPLLQFAGDRKLMGRWALGPVARWVGWVVLAVILVGDLFVLKQMVQS
jgi:manganese transport protein